MRFRRRRHSFRRGLRRHRRNRSLHREADVFNVCTHPMFLASKNILVPCCKCIACQINRKSEWSLRLIHESRDHDSKVFVTLTYDYKNLKTS
ncbi:hypothetical protein AGMMS49921_08640 [Endomicrobiia bacterium]|nr:hypothetical protein AGMMS49921_08640 [Endomicrobiia bacterium]